MMLETAEKVVSVERLRRCVFLLFVGRIADLAEGAHDPRLVLDAYLLRLAVAGYAPRSGRMCPLRCAGTAPGVRGARRGYGVLAVPSRGLGQAVPRSSGADGGAAAR